MRFSLIGIIFLFLSCSSNTQTSEENIISFSGTIAYPQDGGKIFIHKYVNNNPKLYDTVNVNLDGTFNHQLQVEEPSIFMIDVYRTQRFNMILDDEDVVVNAEGTANGQFDLSGSTDSPYLQ